eukprot:TRINITY_DN31270_c0_g1_i1.p1 TRINITY_DN31270_c0_g1~~TRINITY_DN31270_c0_g1_i1.p1  ORF type:complete len:539 (+),score=64.82 TRINITY_DN31270_c0_g1_i1:211-1827(+)
MKSLLILCIVVNAVIEVCAQHAFLEAISSKTLPIIPGHVSKATFALARHGTKAWMGGVDVLNPGEKFMSVEKADHLRRAGIRWIQSMPNRTLEGAAIGQTFGAPGGPSTLTETGMACELKVGEFYKAAFGKGELPSQAYVYSDDDQRDLQSGASFLTGLGVEPEAVGALLDQSMERMLSEMSDKKLIKGCPCASPNEIMMAPKQVEGWEGCAVSGLSIEQVSTYGIDHVASELRYVSDVTGTSEPFENRKESWMGGMDEPLKTWRTLDGGRRSACMLVALWEAELASNVDVEQTMYHHLGVNPHLVPSLMRICVTLWAVNMNSVNRGRNVNFAIQLLSSMQQAVSGEASTLDAVHHAPSASIVMYMAHDYNVEMLRQILGAEWSIDESGRACQGSAFCTYNAKPYHTRLNVEVLKQADSDRHFVRVSVFLVMLAQAKASCTAAQGLTVEENLRVLDIPKALCPSFDDSTKLCPWEEFQDLLIRFIWTTRQSDGDFCAEPSSAAWFRAKHPEKPISVALEESLDTESDIERLWQVLSML